MTKLAKYFPKQHWWDIWTALIALVAITLTGARLEATQWTGHLQILVILSLLAGLTGLALGYSRFSPLIAWLFSTVYGAFLFTFLLGTTVKSDMTWHYRIVNHLGWRLRITINQLIYGNDITDAILFITIMAILLWTIGTISTFVLVRKGWAWASITPLLVTILVFGHYDQDPGRNSRFMISFLFLLLLLIGRAAFLHYQQRWLKEGINVTTRIQIDLSKVLLPLVSGILLIAILIPIDTQSKRRYSNLWRSITEQWERLTDPFAEIFTFETNTSITRQDYSGDTMSLGTDSPNSEEIIFIVQPESKEIEDYRNYWRARSYDLYEDGTWSTSPGTQRLRLTEENFNIQYPRWKDFIMVKYTISIKADRIVNIYAPGTPIWISHPVFAITQPISVSSEDLLALLPRPDLISGDSYKVESNISLLSIANLDESSTEYPSWLNRYLQLPESFSPEIKELAERITEGEDSPYSKTFAITRYLRINMEYSDSIPSAPSGNDPIEWFLLEEKKGFCNYYASAQVLMLRSLGIPARLSVGYAEGAYDPETNTYTVREKNSHAWPEVYFVNYGWVTFEPTVSEPALFLPGLIPPIGEPEQDILEGDLPRLEPLLDTGGEDEGIEEPRGITDAELQEMIDELPGTDPGFSLWDILAIAGIALLIVLAVVLLPRYIKLNVRSLPIILETRLDEGGKGVPKWLRRMSFKAQLSPAERAYRQLGRSIKTLGQPLNLSETPIERAQTLIALLPSAKRQILQVVNAFQLDQYSLQGGEEVQSGKLIDFISKERQSEKESVKTYRLDQYPNQHTKAERIKLIVQRIRKLTRQAWWDNVTLFKF